MEISTQSLCESNGYHRPTLTELSDSLLLHSGAIRTIAVAATTATAVVAAETTTAAVVSEGDLVWQPSPTSPVQPNDVFEDETSRLLFIQQRLHKRHFAPAPTSFPLLKRQNQVRLLFFFFFFFDSRPFASGRRAVRGHIRGSQTFSAFRGHGCMSSRNAHTSYASTLIYPPALCLFPFYSFCFGPPFLLYRQQRSSGESTRWPLAHRRGRGHQQRATNLLRTSC